MYKTLARDALTICQDRVFASLLCVLSLSSVLGSYDPWFHKLLTCLFLLRLIWDLFLWFYFLDTWTWPESFYERGSVLSPVRLPCSIFTELALFFFLKLATMLGAHTLFSYMWNTLPHKSGSAIRIVLQFCIVKAAKRDMEIILLVLWKKSYSEQFGHFLTKMVWRPLNSESALRIFY